MVEHHLVVLAADAGLLVATERRVRRVEVEAVRPDAPSLDSATHAERGIHIATPDTGTESVQRVVGDGQRLLLILESGHREYRTEDFFLENAHLVISLEHRRLNIIAILEIALEQGTLTADQ